MNFAGTGDCQLGTKLGKLVGICIDGLENSGDTDLTLEV